MNLGNNALEHKMEKDFENETSLLISKIKRKYDEIVNSSCKYIKSEIEVWFLVELSLTFQIRKKLLLGVLS